MASDIKNTPLAYLGQADQGRPASSTRYSSTSKIAAPAHPQPALPRRVGYHFYTMTNPGPNFTRQTAANCHSFGYCFDLVGTIKGTCLLVTGINHCHHWKKIGSRQGFKPARFAGNQPILPGTVARSAQNKADFKPAYPQYPHQGLPLSHLVQMTASNFSADRNLPAAPSRPVYFHFKS